MDLSNGDLKKKPPPQRFCIVSISAANAVSLGVCPQCSSQNFSSPHSYTCWLPLQWGCRLRLWKWTGAQKCALKVIGSHYCCHMLPLPSYDGTMTTRKAWQHKQATSKAPSRAVQQWRFEKQWHRHRTRIHNSVTEYERVSGRALVGKVHLDLKRCYSDLQFHLITPSPSCNFTHECCSKDQLQEQTAAISGTNHTYSPISTDATPRKSKQCLHPSDWKKKQVCLQENLSYIILAFNTACQEVLHYRTPIWYPKGGNIVAVVSIPTLQLRLPKHFHSNSILSYS